MGIIYKNGIPYGNQPSIDATLTQQGQAADAKATGDAVGELRNTLNTVKSDLGIVEDTNTATHTIAKGQYVIWKDALYKATQAIPLGTTLSNSNLTAVDSGGLNAVTSRDSGFITTFSAGLTGGALQWERIGPVVVVRISDGSTSEAFINTVIASGLPTNVLDKQYYGTLLWGVPDSLCNIMVNNFGQVLMNVSGAYNSTIYISYVYLTNDY